MFRYSRHSRSFSTALVAVLLAGCGGGGGGGGETDSAPTAVSPNPPAPAPAPEPGTPVVDTPAPPITAPPGTSPGEPAPTTPPAAEAPSISGALLAATFLTSVNVVQRPGVSLGTEQIGIGQYQLSDPDAGRFSIGNAIMTVNNSSRPFPGMALSVPFQLSGDGASLTLSAGAELHAQTIPEGAAYTFPLGPFTDTWYQNINFTTTPRLTSAAALTVNPKARIPSTDTLLQTWRSAEGDWFVEFRVRSETPDTFRTCWEVLLPLVARRSCYTWDMQAGLVGTYVMDNSDGNGAVVYQRGIVQPSIAGKALADDSFAAGNQTYRFGTPGSIR